MKWLFLSCFSSSELHNGHAWDNHRELNSCFTFKTITRWKAQPSTAAFNHRAFLLSWSTRGRGEDFTRDDVMCRTLRSHGLHAYTRTKPPQIKGPRSTSVMSLHNVHGVCLGGDYPARVTRGKVMADLYFKAKLAASFSWIYLWLDQMRLVGFCFVMWAL